MAPISDLERAVDMYKSGSHTLPEIRQATGITKEALYRYFRQTGQEDVILMHRSMVKRKASEKACQKALAMYRDAAAIQDIELEAGVSKSQLYTYMRSQGVQSEAQAAREQKKRERENSNTQLQEALRLYRQGASEEAIKLATGYSWSQINTYLKRSGKEEIIAERREHKSRRKMEERNQQIMLYVNQGWTDQQIADAFGVSRQRINHIRRQLPGVRLARVGRPRKIADTPQNLLLLEKVRQGECGLQEAADQLGVSTATVMRKLNAEGNGEE